MVPAQQGPAAGDYLWTVSVDGFLLDGRLMGVAAEFLQTYGPRIIVVSETSLEFEIGTAPVASSAPHYSLNSHSNGYRRFLPIF